MSLNAGLLYGLIVRLSLGLYKILFKGHVKHTLAHS